MTLQQILNSDLSSALKITALLIVGCSQAFLEAEIRKHQIIGRDLSELVEEFHQDSLIEEIAGVLRFKEGCCPV